MEVILTKRIVNKTNETSGYLNEGYAIVDLDVYFKMKSWETDGDFTMDKFRLKVKIKELEYKLESIRKIILS